MNKFTHAFIFSLLDLTALNDNDDETTIIHLCQQAISPFGQVAAVCIFPRFVKLANKQLARTGVAIAAVANFPSGTQSVEQTCVEIKQAIQDGANEIDVVMPFQAYLAGDRAFCKEFISKCKSACGKNVLLKVILETGALEKSDIIAEASQDVIEAGADFIKTSTGKHAIGATLEAAEIMLNAIKNNGGKVGFKAAGGVRTIEQAITYLTLAEKIMGLDWISPKTFRIGASQLVKLLTVR